MTAIQLDRRIERIMPLECVTGIEKSSYDGSYLFHLEGADGHWANEGDWLIEYDDMWYVITNEQKENGYEPWNE